MKKLLMLLFLFLGSIPVFAQDETLLAGNLSGIEQSGIFVKSDSIGASSLANLLIYAKESEDLNHQTPLLRQSSNRTDLFGTDVENRARQPEKPPISDGKVIGEILAGGAGGIAFGFGGAIIGYGLEKDLTGCEPGGWLDFCGFIGAFIGGSTGIILGSSLGVYAVGNNGNETGSFLATWGGSLGGGIVGFLAWMPVLRADFPDENTALLLLPVATAIGATIGAMIGFNMTRRYKSPPAVGSALINFSEGQTSLAVPTLSFRPAPYVDLVQVRF